MEEMEGRGNLIENQSNEPQYTAYVRTDQKELGTVCVVTAGSSASSVF
jgi:hypothetical protein